jgi:hypothetical protein
MYTWRPPLLAILRLKPAVVVPDIVFTAVFHTSTSLISIVQLRVGEGRKYHLE